MLALVLLLAFFDPAHASSGTAPHRAWELLEKGVKTGGADKRISAVHAVGTIRGSRRAEVLAEGALNDGNPDVRREAANALGEMKARASIPKLRVALDDKEIKVVVASANALYAMNDPEAYQIFFALLTGRRKSKQGLLQSQLDTLHDRKAVEKMAFEAGIGFIPYAGMGLDAWRVIMHDDESTVEAAAALKLANDPDPRSLEALKAATDHKKWQVRAAAATALGQRGDRRLLKVVIPMLDDDNAAVTYAAAAAVIRLSPGKW